MMKPVWATVFAAAFALSSPLVAARPKVGEPAPDFKVTTFDGAKLTLADFRGDVVVINIWATWCGPCKAELPLLDSYYAVMSKHGLKVVAITTEDSVPNNYLKPLQKVLSLPLARSFHGAYRAINDAVPSNYVIDRRGIVRYAKAGAFDLKTLNEILLPLLNEPRPPS